MKVQSTTSPLPPSRATAAGKPADAVPPPASLDVTVPDKTHARSGYFQYVLKDGRIWSKWDPILPRHAFEIPCDPTARVTARGVQRRLDAITGPYTFRYQPEKRTLLVTPKPVDGTGYQLRGGKLTPVPLEQAQAWSLVENGGGPTLPRGEKVESFEVAADSIRAVTNKGRVFGFDPGEFDDAHHTAAWKPTVGAPLLDHQVKVPKGIRDWAFGRSGSDRPGARMMSRAANPFTDIDAYYTDEAGHRVAFNETDSMGVLSADGRQIHFRDCGLPADFARGFLTPQKGRFVADKLSQAGSTWLVYGHKADGRPGLYVRQYDYEIFGACPQKNNVLGQPKSTGTGVAKFLSATEQMPRQGWRELSLPDVGSPPASVTDQVAILNMGQGNDAREVRMAGTNAWGQPGYYHCTLADPRWRFTPGTQAPTGKAISVGRVDPAARTPTPLAHDFPHSKVSAALQKLGVKSVQLEDFQPLQTLAEPSQLTFTLDSGKKVSVRLRSCDGWQVLKMPGHDDLDAFDQGVGVGQILAGTLELPPEVRKSKDPQVQRLVQRVLGPLDGIGNGLVLTADQGSVQVRAGRYASDSERRLPELSFSVSRDATGESAYEREVAKVKLPPHLSSAALREKISQLQNLEGKLQHQERSRRERYIPQTLLGGIAAGGYLAINELTQHTPLGHVEFLRSASNLVQPLGVAHEAADLDTVLETPAGYTRARHQLEDELGSARRQLRAVEKNDQV